MIMPPGRTFEPRRRFSFVRAIKQGRYKNNGTNTSGESLEEISKAQTFLYRFADCKLQSDMRNSVAKYILFIV
jgi:hypothetical protein